MDVLVPIAWIVDPQVVVHPNATNTAVETTAAPKIINPFDAIALQAAINWKKEGIIQRITALHIGTEQQGLRQALAMGADQAILLQHNEPLFPLNVAKALAAWLKQHPTYQLVCMGKQASDDDQAQVGPMLSALMGWSQGLYASHIDLCTTHADVTQEVDHGLSCIRCPLPSVITTDLRLNTPQPPSMMQIMQAQKQTIVTHPLEDLITLPHSTWQLEKVACHQKQRPCTPIDDIPSLIQALKERGVTL